MNIVITGASQGIGFETVKSISSSGNHIVITLSRNIKRLEELETLCLKINPSIKIHSIQFDLKEENHFLVLKEKICSLIDRVDVLINNAGYLSKGLIEDITEEDMRSTYEVNLFGPIKLIQLLKPLMGVSSKAHILNIGSIGGYQGSSKFSGLSLYSTSKSALHTLTECLAEEFRGDNISVNCLALGGVNTEMLARAFPDYVAPTSAQEMGAYITAFILNEKDMFNGKVLPVSQSTP